MRHRLILFAALVLALATLMALTTPSLIRHTRIGLEFRGGYDMVFVAKPLSGATGGIGHDQLLEAVAILGERANRLGVSEPKIDILGADQIRVELAGMAPDDGALASLRAAEGLPVRLVESYSETVGGVLGRDDLAATLGAGGIAVALISAFLVVVYRGPGVVAVVTLVTFLWLLLVAFNLLDATLSLAAIVAFVLGLGIASGANILTLERTREALGAGMPVGQAVREGCRRSWRTIVDANATVFICALVLFIVGIGPVTGFALTTMLGIVLSLVANVLLARGLLVLVYGGEARVDPPFAAKAPALFDRPGFDVLRRGRWFVGGSVAAGLLGCAAVATVPLNYDIEFKAGTALDIRIGTSITQERATDLIASSGTPAATVAIGGPLRDLIAARFDDVLDTPRVDAVVRVFKRGYGPAVTFAENTADPSAARQLARQSALVVLLALVGTALFILARFDWRFAVAAMAVVLNAVAFVVTVFAVFGLEIDITFIAALLTVIGYALNEAIVVFDRIRDTLRARPPSSEADLEVSVNAAVRQVCRRSLHTVLTVVIGAVCLFTFGAEPLMMFSLAILLGLVCGTFSSLCVAPTVWVALRPPTARPDVPATVDP